jgi:anti-sigma factor RsiW
VTAACEHCRDLIGGYVLDALDPDERELVRRHLQVCEPCAREHAELATIPALLDVADSADVLPLRPPARLEEAVLDRFARERRGSPPRRVRGSRRLRRRWLAPAAVGLACVLAALVAVLALGGDERRPGQVAGDAVRVYRVAMRGDGPTPDAAGDARLYPGATGTGVHLSVRGLKPNAYQYELWCVRDDGWRISAGTFRVDASGRADVRLTTAAMPTEYHTLAIEARGAGGGASAPGWRVLVGRIQ